MRFDNSSHRRLPPSRGKLPIKNNCRLLLPVLGINILSLNFVFVNLSRYVRKALFSLLKCARGFFLPFTFPSVIWTTAPFFVKRKPFAFFFSSLADILASRGSRRRRRDAPHRAKSLFRSIIKTRQNKSGFYGGETGICSCLLQSNTCEIFLCFAKVFGQPLKTTHRVVFLTLSFKSLLLSVVKQKRTSEFACPFCLAGR